MGLLSRTDDHQWSQQHLSHYVEGDLGRRARRRLDRHAKDCVDCGRGIRAMRALLRLIPGIEGTQATRAPAGIFDKVRSGGTERRGDDGTQPPTQDS
jgi:Putative zinc-finger